MRLPSKGLLQGVPPRWGVGTGTGWMIEGCLWDRMGWGERPVCRCGLAHFPFSERSSERMLLPGKMPWHSWSQLVNCSRSHFSYTLEKTSNQWEELIQRD